MCSKYFLASLLGLLVASSQASAATFNFVALAAGNEHGAVSESFSNGGITVTATARSLDAASTYKMYLDDLSGGPGGLGVCKATGSGGGCINGADDNIGLNEVLMLSFDQAVEITGISFSNGGHVDVYRGNFGVAINSSPTTIPGFTQYVQGATFVGSLIGTTFSFISNATLAGGNLDKDVIYISSLTARAVPEPMTVGLLGLGLLPLARKRFARR